ncbi:MAG: M23 family metallopeptidase, partial [Clostridia bacterium]|nr:M23 family metallopeptidase [Clostridia bacterium]
MWYNNFCCVKNKHKRRVYIILKLKLKSIFRSVTKETARAIKIMILGFILITATLTIKYKPVYEVKVESETIGYITNNKKMSKTIEEQITKVEGNNVDNVSFKQEPKYELKLVSRKMDINENDVIERLKKEAVTTYKFYTVSLNGKSKAYVDTIEEAEKVVKKIKSGHKGDGLDLDITIEEQYTENKSKVKTDSIKTAQKQVEKTVDELLEEKEAKEALAVINGINVSALPVRGTITSRFGVSSSIRRSRHTGLDIACRAGTSIKAVAKGKVVCAKYSGSYGNLIKIDHGKGVQTWYAHCSKLYVKPGQQVAAGDVIGAVGSTGNSTGPHL